VISEHMAWSVLADLLLVVHDEHAPGDAEWDRWLRDYAAGAADLRAMIVYSLGGGPASAQRKKLLETISQLPRAPDVFMVTSSALARGVVTALSWFLPAAHRAKTFRLDELDRVFAVLDLDAAARKAAKLEIDTLMSTLPSRLGLSRSAGA
jgi:hypothetical protein